MDREHHRQQRKSSLPSSLIPHLFSGPQQPRYSQTRTTLQTEDLLPTPFSHPREPTSPPQSFGHHPRQFPPLELPSIDARDRHSDRRLPDPPSTPLHRVLDPPSSSQPYGNPIYSNPIFHSATHTPMSSSRLHTYSLPPLSNPDNRHLVQPLDSWREGEAGPSSLLRPVSHDEAAFSRRRRGSNQPLRVEPRSSELYMSRSPVFEHGPPIQEPMRHRGERDTYLPSSGRSWPGDYHSSQSVRSFERLPGPAQLFDRSPGNQSPSYEQLHERQESYSFPAVGSLSISAPTPSYVRGRSSDTGSLHRSEARSIEVGSNDGEGSQRGKRRRAESVETDDNAKKSRNSRKTAVACNFCRGRKLRCNGEKPSCYNCTVRKFECEYVPVQRRRGPGKAPKGSRKRGGGRMDSKGAGDRPSVAVAEHELDSLAPEVRPYMSVLSLNSFGFQAPPPSPQYPARRWTPSGRGRRSGSRETSSEDRSDGERGG